MSEQFYTNNPREGLLRFALVDLLTATQKNLTVDVDQDPNLGATYNSTGTVSAGANEVAALPNELVVQFHAQPATEMVDQSFFIAPYACQVARIDYVHAVAETTAATLRVQVTKDDGTEAPGAGDDLLTNTGGAGFDAKAVANTVQNGTLTATTAFLQLAAGDRLGVDFSAAATELVGVTITVRLTRR